MNQLAIISNPSAGSYKKHYLEQVRAGFEGWDIRGFSTLPDKDQSIRAIATGLKGYFKPESSHAKLILILSGDGGATSAVQSALQAEVNADLLILPGGSTNDVAWACGMSQLPEPASLVESLKKFYNHKESDWVAREMVLAGCDVFPADGGEVQTFTTPHVISIGEVAESALFDCRHERGKWAAIMKGFRLVKAGFTMTPYPVEMKLVDSQGVGRSVGSESISWAIISGLLMTGGSLPFTPAEPGRLGIQTIPLPVEKGNSWRTSLKNKWHRLAAIAKSAMGAVVLTACGRLAKLTDNVSFLKLARKLFHSYFKNGDYFSFKPEERLELKFPKPVKISAGGDLVLKAGADEPLLITEAVIYQRQVKTLVRKDAPLERIK